MSINNTFLVKMFSMLLTFSIIFFPLVGFAGESQSNVYTISIVPSTNILSEKYEKGLHDTEYKLVETGYTNEEIKNIYLAFDNRDMAWEKAGEIIKGITNGQINSENIFHYSTHQFKYQVGQATATMMLNTIKSLGSKANLSADYIPGLPIDFMVLQKQHMKGTIIISVIHRIDRSKQQLGLNESTPYTGRELTIILAAHYPYKKWLLSGVQFREKPKNYFLSDFVHNT